MTSYNQASQRENVYLTEAGDQDQDPYGFHYQISSEYCNPLGYCPQSPSKPSDWVFSPLARPVTPYLESPLSSVGVSHDLSWNPFDQSFASVQISIDDGSFVSPGNSQANAYQTGYSISNIQSDAQSCLSLAAINETSTFNNVIENEDIPGNTYKTPPLRLQPPTIKPEKQTGALQANATQPTPAQPDLYLPASAANHGTKGPAPPTFVLNPNRSHASAQ